MSSSNGSLRPRFLRTSLFLLVLVVLSVSLPALAADGRRASRAHVSDAAVTSKTFTLATGSNGYLATGIKLKKGAKAEITVAGNGKCGAGSDCPAGNPNGSGSTCAARSLGPLAPGPVASADYGAVVGQVGTEPPFQPGASKTVTGEGELRFVYNDCAGYYGDNTGSFTITVKYRSSEHHLKITFSPTSVAGTGMGISEATITDLDEKEEPVGGEELVIEPPIIWGEGKASAIVCDQEGRLVSPTHIGPNTGVLGNSVKRITDGAGQVRLKIYHGPVGEEWPLDAYEESDPNHTRYFGGVKVTPGGASSQLPLDLVPVLVSAGENSLGDFGGTGQRSVMAWLGRESGALGGVSAVPIYAVDAVGATNPAVVLFANNEGVRRAVLSYLETGGATPAPGDLQAAVLDIRTMRTFQLGAALAGQKLNKPPFRLPSLDEWAKGTTIQIADPNFQAEGHATHVPIPARGQPHFGLVGATPNEELLYGYGPSPPSGAAAEVEAAFSRCVGYQGNTTITPHSPVRLQALAAGGLTAGIDVHGKAVNTIPDAIVNHRGAKLTSLELPAGKIQLKVSGTGAGPATLVIDTPSAKGTVTRVFTFKVKRGQSGSVALGSGGPSTMRWAGRTIRASDGLRLTLHGLPSRLSPRRAKTIKLRVTDQFGAPAPGVAVSFAGAPLGTPLTFHTDSRGSIAASVKALRRGVIALRLSGGGYVALTRSLHVR